VSDRIELLREAVELEAARIKEILRIRAENKKLKKALETLARWQVDHAPGGDGAMCDFAEAALKEIE
jgi:hypothetical protein